MRLSAVALAVALAGIVGGAWLIGMWAVGCAVIFDSLCVGAWALMRDDGKDGQPQMPAVHSVADVLERARKAS